MVPGPWRGQPGCAVISVLLMVASFSGTVLVARAGQPAAGAARTRGTRRPGRPGPGQASSLTAVRAGPAGGSVELRTTARYRQVRTAPGRSGRAPARDGPDRGR